MTAKQATGWTIIAAVFVFLFIVVAYTHGTTSALIAFAVSAILTTLMVFGIRLTVD